MITLKEITKTNFWDCIDLTVSLSQKNFVSPNALSIAQSKVQPECIPLAIYKDETMVGFVMYCLDEDDYEYWIYRLMIDIHHQGNGYGKQALNQVISLIKEDKTHHQIYLGVHPESLSAVKIYEDLGFQFNRQIFGSEHVMKLTY